MASTPEMIPAIPWVERENHRFIAILRALSEDKWRAPTWCTGWSAADVVAHMTLGARFYAHVIPAGRAGLIEMPFGAADQKSFWAHRDKVGAELAALPGSERVDAFEEAIWALQKQFDAIRTEDMNNKAWHWMCLCPVHSYPGQRLYELVLHDWDIRNDTDQELHPDALGMSVDILDFRLPFFFNNKPDPALSGTFRFETERPARAWAMQCEGGKAAPMSPDESKYDARIYSSASDIVLLTTGRADYAEKKQAGKLRIEGDEGKADALMRALCKPF
ncbi:MAG: maleylpyruvate isomerase family mycothiol-dependent enzyme [Nitrospinaceae bacterium]|nr:maleylpyruvate isomerase family mycothiol-dependent enzyme [Nitrospinaceae bacterium]MBT3432299.1 maleylpyruvate isomerase family mycothiol-dependent enzyme [Nitrospinaceae bacterium]MBT3819799.1 maleylpyruvate isomerase family mycothiol-dependent enzyme [Nitrospinaceae bacterium]MBT4095252.1 maleylpyruvate isomerase family mycothiol-dependent enzyme [Nitrospinaceae bacterium]MBT4431956.1 maleylpyruvate isomerase family mycothiol-dependent enzyme [Nitrospinaceae bacterium]